MAKEIERKYKVVGDAFQKEATKSIHIKQAYLVSSEEGCTVRVRMADEVAFLTLKSPSSCTGLVRNEWEYSIPFQDAEEMIKGSTIIEKERFLVPYKEHLWEVDCFSGFLDGLVIAEVELHKEDETVSLPPWVGEEVTGKRAYYNAVLAQEGLPSPN